MRKIKVFLLADIGRDKSGMYHVGDEAMFLSNLENYQSQDIFEISASSRSISHQNLEIHEFLDIYILNLFQFFKLIIQAVLYRYLRINLFPKFFKPTVIALSNSDILHVSGGGNINSLWPGHIYYRSLMIFIASLFEKKIVLTSQTIGPITNPLHKLILGNVLNRSNYIGARDTEFSFEQLKKLGVNKKLIHFNFDDALLWLGNKIEKSGKNLNLGISLHDPNNRDLSKQLGVFVKQIHARYKHVNTYLVPHFLDSKDNYDVKYMSGLVKNIKSRRIKVIDYKFLSRGSHNTEIAEKIRQITSNMDLVIASRYHGIVFGLSASAPCLAINYDNDYYHAKNTGLVKQFYKGTDKFVVDFNDIKSDYMLSKFDYLISNQKKIAKQLSTKLREIYDQDKKTKNSIYRLERNSIKI
jgi:polysaccharide pyruvyl transferase WcaK-like protein